MKRSLLRYGLGGLALYALFLVLTAPAAWLAGRLPGLTQQRVALAAPQGSLWYGSGDLLLTLPGAGTQNIGRAHWRIQPLALFTAKLRYAVELQLVDGRLAGSLYATRDGVVVDELQGRLSAPGAARLYPPLGLFDPAGEVTVRASAFGLAQRQVSGQAELTWQGAASNLSAVKPLGDYRLTVTGQGQSARLRLETVKGSLSLTGEGLWMPTVGALQFNGMARPLERAADLEPLLRLLGPDRGAGQRSLSVNAR